MASHSPALDEPSSSLLLHQAQTSAKRMVVSWIRQVFREASLQVLRHYWIHNCTNTTDQPNPPCEIQRLVVTKEVLETCRRVCKRLGDAWSRKLSARGLSQVSEWVQETLQRYDWFHSDDQHSSLTSPEYETVTTPQDDSSTNHETYTAAVSESSNYQPLPYTRLRQLNKSTTTDPTTTLSTLDALGRTGQTLWKPHDYQLVEDAALEIPKRLYSKTPTASIQVLPKSLAGTLTDQDRSILVNRKRKKPRKTNTVATASNTQPTVSQQYRQASSLHTHQYTMQEIVESLSRQERQELEQEYIHKKDNNEDGGHLIMGALKKVGHVHFWLQNQVEDDWEARHKRKATKERLGPAQVETAEGHRRSKVLRTTRQATNSSSFLDLDMGECLLQLEWNGTIRLCALASIELTLTET